MENIIEDFKVEDKPVNMKNSFPYNKVLNTLVVLDHTKSVTFQKGEIKSCHVQYLRTMAKKRGLGDVRSAVINGKTFIWINK